MFGNESIRYDGERFVLAPTGVEVKKGPAEPASRRPLGVQSNSPSEGEHKHPVIR